MPSNVAEPAARRVDLDWIRVWVFAGLIFYHVGLLYAPWSIYFMKSAHSHTARPCFGPLNRAIRPATYPPQ